jgi:hypothetical protein
MNVHRHQLVVRPGWQSALVVYGFDIDGGTFQRCAGPQASQTRESVVS